MRQNKGEKPIERGFFTLLYIIPMREVVKNEFKIKNENSLLSFIRFQFENFSILDELHLKSAFYS